MAWQWKPAIKKLHQQFPVGFCLNHHGNFKGKPRTTRHVMTLYQNNVWISNFFLFFTFFKGYRCNQFAVITRNKMSHESPRLFLDQTDTRKAERKFFCDHFRSSQGRNDRHSPPPPPAASLSDPRATATVPVPRWIECWWNTGVIDFVLTSVFYVEEAYYTWRIILM